MEQQKLCRSCGKSTAAQAETDLITFTGTKFKRISKEEFCCEDCLQGATTANLLLWQIYSIFTNEFDRSLSVKEMIDLIAKDEDEDICDRDLANLIIENRQFLEERD